MFTIRTSKNSYKFINIDGLKVKAFNAATVALAVYGLVTIIK